MANWTDGPEYAPLDRPLALETPLAEPLEVPPPVTNPAAGAPVVQPDMQPPQGEVVPLADLVPTSGSQPRDPHTEFTTVSSALTGTSTAWGSAHSATETLDRSGWTPDQPLGSAVPINTVQAALPGAVPAQPAGPTYPPPQGLNFPPPQQPAPSFPQPGTPDWFAPPPQEHWQPPNQTVTVAQMWNGATPGVIIPLIIGALVNPLSLIMLGLSAILAGRVKYRRAQVRRSYALVGAFLAFIGVLSLFNSDFDTTWSILSGWGQLACWVLPLVVLLQVGAGIRANEPPQRPY